MEAWRGTEENPFHTEVGYWLWDATDGQVMRCFLIPRGSALIAGGAVAELECLTLWEPRLRRIVLPAPDNVLALRVPTAEAV